MASKAPPSIPEELLDRAEKLIPALARQSLWGTATRRHVILHAFVLGLERMEAAAAAGEPIPQIGTILPATATTPTETFPKGVADHAMSLAADQEAE